MSDLEKIEDINTHSDLTRPSTQFGVFGDAYILVVSEPQNFVYLYHA